MKELANTFSSLLLVAFLATTATARADHNPDFDDDAKPILRQQPGLLQYVESNFDVKDTGYAKYPGDDDVPPRPPYIFRARPRGSDGPYNLRLLIQPGHPGHILGVVDINKVNLSEPGESPKSNKPKAPAVAAKPTPPPSPAPTTPSYPVHNPSAPVVSAPAPQPTQPTADTPSGPIPDTGSAPTNTLAPPPDPSQTTQH